MCSIFEKYKTGLVLLTKVCVCSNLTHSEIFFLLRAQLSVKQLS